MENKIYFANINLQLSTIDDGNQVLSLESSYHRSPTKRNIQIKSRTIRFPGTDKICQNYPLSCHSP